MTASMSPLVTRPSLPVPATAAGSTPDSAASLRTEGACGPSAFFAGAGAALASAFGVGFAAALAPPAPSLIEPSRAPTETVSPSLAAIDASTPLTGAGTSTVTLSVSSSTSGSSTATVSPACLYQRPMVASVTDSPSVGTRISIAMAVIPAPRRGTP
jgi:hypothetical protein